MVYGSNASPLWRMIRRSARENRALLRSRWRIPLATARALLDAEHLLASQIIGLLQPRGNALSGHGEEVRPAVAAFHKNLFHLYAALELTTGGLTGPARVLFRTMFEALYLGKFCVVRSDDALVTRWATGKPVSLSVDVFRRIAHPTLSETQTFWTAACRAVHATVYSGQVPFAYDEDLVREAGSNVAILLALLVCSYHLLSQHLLTPGIWYHMRRYFPADAKLMVRRRARCKCLAAQAQRLMSRPARTLVREYVACWHVS